MVINKAILHIMDFMSNINVYSEKELDFSNSAVCDFLEKHIEHILADGNKKSGEFLPESSFYNELKTFLGADNSLVEFSTKIAKRTEEQFALAELSETVDFVMADFINDEIRYIAILIIKNKSAFTHQVMNDEEGLHNEIIRHYAILPSTSQKIDSYALINCNDFSVGFVDKRKTIDGKTVNILPDIILQCSAAMSENEAVKKVNKIAEKVCEEYGENATVTASKTKQYLAEAAETSSAFSPVDLGKEIFSDCNNSQIMQDDFVQRAVSAKLPETVAVNKEAVARATKNQKIKTDTGIEISVPSQYFQDSKYIEIINNSDGTLSIELKNIGKIINK